MSTDLVSLPICYGVQPNVDFILNFSYFCMLFLRRLCKDGLSVMHKLYLKFLFEQISPNGTVIAILGRIMWKIY